MRTIHSKAEFIEAGIKLKELIKIKYWFIGMYIDTDSDVKKKYIYIMVSR